ncbi:hypothetical protein LGM92_08725 [Burkholderia vietnamiensis]|nr:hypothetical protein [Burkholderia vietnamiensis]
MKTFDCRGHVVTAPSRRTGVDFVSRSFFPALGVNEGVGPLQTGAVLGRASGAASLVGAAGAPARRPPDR